MEQITSRDHSFVTLQGRAKAGVFQGDVLAGLPFPAQTLKQVHGTRVVEVTQVGEEVEGDALLTVVPGVRILIKTADCIPLVLADIEAGVVAAVHAGWRGLVTDIVPRTLEAMAAKGAKVERIQVGVGPSLGVECSVFSAPFEEIPAKYHWAVRADSHVDLWAILERQLVEGGVAMERVEWMRVCTACHPEWFSWRRDHDSRRLGTWIELSL